MAAPLNGGDNGFLVAEDAHSLAIEIAGGAVAGGCVSTKSRRAVEVRACAEGLALRGEHDRAGVHVLVDLIERIGNLPDQRQIEEVQRRPANLDQRDMPVFFDADIGEAVS